MDVTRLRGAWRRLGAGGLVMLGAATALSGCTFVETRLNPPEYQQPEDGARARVRIVAEHGDLQVQPGTSCRRPPFVGAGSLGTAAIGGPRAWELGMPNPDGVRHRSEIYARADEPLLVHVQVPPHSGGCGGALPVGSTVRTTCRPGPTIPGCSTALAFVPEAGADYEVRLQRMAGQCIARLALIETDEGGRIRMRSLPALEAQPCTGTHGVTP